MADQLKIRIIGTLNSDATVVEINKALSNLEKKISNIKLNVQLDDTVLKSITNFNNQMKELSQTAIKTGKVIEEALMPDSTKVKRTYFNGLKNEFQQTIEEAKKVKSSVDQVTNGLNNQQKSIKELTNDYLELNKQIRYNNDGSKKYITTTYQNKKGNGRIITTDAENNVISYKDVENVAKFQKEQNKLRKDLQELGRTGRYTTEELRKIGQGINFATTLKELDQLKNRMSNMRFGTSLSTDQEKVRQSLQKLYQQGLVNEKFFKNFNKTIDSTKNIAEIEKVQKALQRVGDVSKNKNLQQSLLSQAQSLSNSNPNLQNNQQFNNLITSLKNIRPNAAGAIKDIQQIQKELGGFQRSAQMASQHAMSFGDMLSQAFTKFPIWMLASTAFFAPIQALNKMVDTLYLLDERLVSIDKVLENADLTTVFENANKAALKYGKTIDGALQSLGEISKLGFNQKDAEQLNNNAMILSTVGEFKDDSEAANYLVAIMRQYKLTIEQTAQVVDSFNEVSNKTGADTLGLAQALSKSSSAAANAGVSFNDLNGMVSSTIETLKISGNEAGSFYKSLFTRFLREDTQNTLVQAGIQVKSLNGELRSATDVLQDLGKKWNTYSSQQKNAIAQSLGGVYYINKVSSLLENQANVYKNTQFSINSYNSAQKELETFQQGLQYQTNQMIASFQKLAWTIGQNGARDGLLLLIEGITNLTQGFTKLTEVTNGWNFKLPILIGLLYGGAKAFTALKLAVTGLKLSFGVIGIGVLALETLASVFMKSASAANLNTDSLEENAKKTAEQTNTLQTLISKYDELQSQAKNNSDKQRELQSVLKDIQRIAPQLIDSTGKHGDALTLNKDKVDKYIESLKKMTDEQVKQAQTANSIELSNVNVDIDKEQKNLDKMESSVKESFDRIQSYQKKYRVSGLIDSEKDYAKRFSELTKKSTEAQKKGNLDLASKYTSESNKIFYEFEQYSKLMRDNSGELSKYSEKIRKIQELESKKAGLKERKKALDELNNSVQKNSSFNEDNANSLSEVAKGYYEGTDGMDAMTDSAGEAADANKALLKSYKNSISNIESLNGVINDLNENQKLSSDSVAFLLENYADLLPYINDEATLRQKVVEQIEKENKVAKQAMYEKLKNNEQLFNSLLNGNKDYFNKLAKMYSFDLKNTKTLAQAKAQIESKLIQGLSERWGKYYDTNANAISKQGEALLKQGGEMGLYLVQDYAKAQQELKGISDKFGELSTESIDINFSDSGLKDSTDKANDALEDSKYVSDQYKKSLESVNLELEKYQTIQNKFPNYSREYQDSLKSEIKLLEQKKKLIESQASSLQQQINSGKITETGIVTTKPPTTSNTTTYSQSSGKYTGQYASYINQAAAQYGVDPNLIAAIIKQESGFNAKARSYVGAMGLMQLMPGTAAGLGVKNAYDPYENIMGGTKYIAQQLKAFGGSVEKALAAYNAGPGNVRKYGGIPPFTETQNYVKRIMANYKSGGSVAVTTTPSSNDAIKQANEASKLEAERQSAIDNAKSEVLSLQQESLQIDDQIQQLYMDIVESNLASIDYAKKTYEDDLAKYDYQQSFFNPNTPEWMRAQINKEIVYKNLANAEQESIKYLQQQIKYNNDLTAAQKAQLDDQLIDRQKELISLEKQLFDARMEMANEVVDTYKKALEAQRDASVKSIDKMIDAINKSVDESDYKKKLSDAQKSRQEILDEITKLSLDDSSSAKKRLSELNKQLEESNVSIYEMQSDKAKQNRLDNLNQQKENITTYYDNILNDEAKFAKMRASIIQMSNAAILKDLLKFASSISKDSDLLGGGATKSLVALINRAAGYLDMGGANLKNIKPKKFNTGGYTGNSEGLAYLDKKEIILKETDTSNFLKSIDLARDIFKNISIPKIPTLSSSPSSSTGNNPVSINFYVDKMTGNQDDFRKFMGNIMDGVKKLGL